jgi:hypothetical protein
LYLSVYPCPEFPILPDFPEFHILLYPCPEFPILPKFPDLFRAINRHEVSKCERVVESHLDEDLGLPKDSTAKHMKE